MIYQTLHSKSYIQVYGPCCSLSVCIFQVIYSRLYIPMFIFQVVYSSLDIATVCSRCIFQGFYSRSTFQDSYSRLYIPGLIFQVLGRNVFPHNLSARYEVSHSRHGGGEAEGLI